MILSRIARQPLERTNLVRAHEAAVAFDIRCEDRDAASAGCQRVRHAGPMPLLLRQLSFRNPEDWARSKRSVEAELPRSNHG